MSARLVRRHPVANVLLPLRLVGLVDPALHVGPVQGDVLGGASHAAQLDEFEVIDGMLDVTEGAPITESAPGNQFRARCDRRRLVELEHGEPPGHIDQRVRFGVGVEELCANCDPTCLGACQLVDHPGQSTRDSSTLGTGRSAHPSVEQDRMVAGW